MIGRGLISTPKELQIPLKEPCRTRFERALLKGLLIPTLPIPTVADISYTSNLPQLLALKLHNPEPYMSNIGLFNELHRGSLGAPWPSFNPKPNSKPAYQPNRNPKTLFKGALPIRASKSLGLWCPISKLPRGPDNLMSLKRIAEGFASAAGGAAQQRSHAVGTTLVFFDPFKEE